MSQVPQPAWEVVPSHVPGNALNTLGGGQHRRLRGRRTPYAFYAFGPTLGSAANATLMSYRGVCHVGIDTDTGAVPDPEVFARCLREGFDEVLALAD